MHFFIGNLAGKTLFEKMHSPTELFMDLQAKYDGVVDPFSKDGAKRFIKHPVLLPARNECSGHLHLM